MKLTPLDIRTHEFARKVRGYDPDEVRAFTEMVSRQWEEMQEDLRRAEDRVREIEGKITHYEKIEEALQEALATSREGAKRTQANAEERARLIVEEAELKAEQITQEAGQKHHQLRHEVAQLAHRHDEITARLRHFLMSELEILARHEDDKPIGFMKLMPSAPAEALPSVSPPALPQTETPVPTPPEPAPPVAADEVSVPDPVSAPDPVVPAPAAAGGASDEAVSDETTYAELYARAAEAESNREADRPIVALEEPEEEAEPTWTLRSIVGGELDEEPRESEPATAPATEKERIRRILEDLE
ncbi:MAG: DivIVA domain-containing protein [Bacteroidota bacterium]